MEMFILRYANVLCIYPKLCLQVGFTSWLRTYLPNQYVIFRYCSPSEGDQPWDFFGGNDAKAETPILWPPHAKSWLIIKDPDAGRDWGQEEKGMTEDEMAGWQHQLDGHEFE